MDSIHEKNNRPFPKNPTPAQPIPSQQSDPPSTKNLPVPTGQPTLPTSISWQALEYEKTQRSQNWYLGIFIFIFVMVAYAFFTDNLLMSIIFILFAVLAYLFDKKVPRTITLSITSEGISAHDTLYEYMTLESFWIFYEPLGKKVVSLKSKKKYQAYLHLPIGQANPAEIRKVLLQYLPEIKQEEGLIDAVEALL